MQVLMIGNDENNREIEENFIISGFNLLTLGKAGEGVSFVCEEQPDLVIVDLPSHNDEWIACIRDIRRASSVPLILLAGCVEEVFKIIELDLGIDDYITKPLCPRELVARARAVLRRSNGSSSSEREIDGFDDFVLNAQPANAWPAVKRR